MKQLNLVREFHSCVSHGQDMEVPEPEEELAAAVWVFALLHTDKRSVMYAKSICKRNEYFYGDVLER